jgi:hypothetical protein
MLKPIPQESPDEIRKDTAAKARRFMRHGHRPKSGKRSPMPAGDFFAEGSGADIAYITRIAIPAKQTGEQKFLCKINRKLQADAKKDRNIIKNVCMRMISFIRKNGRTSTQEVGELIHGLKRSVLSLERQRQREFNKERKRKKK